MNEPPPRAAGVSPPASSEQLSVGAAGDEARSLASPPPAPGITAPLAGLPRLRCVDRQQLLPPMSLDQLIEPDHRARAVWRFVESLDLSLLYDRIRSRDNHQGRPAIDPRILVALWLYATLYGVVSARRLSELCVQHNAFRWLAGGVSVNHHTLSDFHVENLDFLEQMFKDSVEVLRQQGLVDLDRVAQDGMRVRASAGAASFRRRATLEEALAEAEAELERLSQEAAETGEAEVDAAEDDTQQEVTARQRAARRRAAKEQVERLQQALQRLPEMQAKKKKEEKQEARVSTTDPQATVMKMANGGYNPAYNIQYSTDCGSLVIVGVAVVSVGSDQGQLPPMLQQIEDRFKKRPKEALVDGGYVKHEDIEEVQKAKEGKAGCKVYAPVPKPKKEGVDRHAPHLGDSEQVAEWRKRMATQEAKKIYKQRAATAECVNAQARNRGLIQLLVRGVQKVKAIALWFATAHNLARAFVLLLQPTATG